MNFEMVFSVFVNVVVHISAFTLIGSVIILFAIAIFFSDGGIKGDGFCIKNRMADRVAEFTVGSILISTIVLVISQAALGILTMLG